MFFNFVSKALALTASGAILVSAAPQAVNPEGCIPQYGPAPGGQGGQGGQGTQVGQGGQGTQVGQGAQGSTKPLGEVPSGCPPLSGTFNITNPHLYPENFDWDTKRCLLYASGNPNATLMIFNPYTSEQNILEFPEVSHNTSWHTSGIDYDAKTDSLFVTAGAAQTWESNGQNVQGPDRLFKINPETREVVWTADFGNFMSQVEQERGFKIGGFQDQAEDAEGNTYCMAAWGNSIAKIDGKTGAIAPFYLPPAEQKNVTDFGMLGIVAVDAGKKLVITDNVGKRITTFDLSQEQPKDVDVQLTNMPGNYSIWCDGIYAPAKYNEQVLICSDNYFAGNGAGALVLYGSKDSWKTAQHLGHVLNNDVDNGIAVGSSPVATTQIGESIYVCEQYFFDDPAHPFAYGQRESFPMMDITKEIDAIARPFVESASEQGADAASEQGADAASEQGADAASEQGADGVSYGA